MMRHNLPEDAWQKSSYSTDNGGQCIETQPTTDGLVALGDSKDRSLGAFTFSTSAWTAFVDATKTGSFGR
jgi:hypothetical protein